MLEWSPFAQVGESHNHESFSVQFRKQKSIFV